MMELLPEITLTSLCRDRHKTWIDELVDIQAHIDDLEWEARDLETCIELNQKMMAGRLRPFDL